MLMSRERAVPGPINLTANSNEDGPQIALTLYTDIYCEAENVYKSGSAAPLWRFDRSPRGYRSFDLRRGCTALRCPPYSALVDSARDRDDLATLAFAGVMSMACSRPSPYNVPIAGGDRVAVRALIARYFPTHDPTPWVEATPTTRWTDTARLDEFQDLVDLLNEHASYDTEECRWVALSIATASMGANHLWQDMALPNRSLLSRLIEQNFTSLFIRNVGDMKWKKFFYRQLCEKAEVLICKSPSCGICIDFNVCFGKDELNVPGHFTIEPEHDHR